MRSKWSLVIIVGLAVLVVAIIYLAQAVEPTRAPAVEVIERDRLAR